MYQFYMNDETGAIMQVYNDGDITDEYAKKKIDSLTGDRASEYSPVCMALNLYDFAQVILPFTVSDEMMRIWKFSNQTLDHSRTYKETAVEPYYAVDVVNETDKVQMIGV